MGISNGKYYCPVDDWAAKGPCPVHPGQSVWMGKQWRPGKKGSRERLWSLRSSRNRQMPPAKRSYHVFHGVPQFIQDLGIEVPAEVTEKYWSHWRTANPVHEAISLRGRKQRQRKRRNRAR